MTLTLPEGDFKAYLFDCDGTIADSMPLHYVAWTQALAEYGCTSFTEELFYAWGGMPVGAVVDELNQRDSLSIPIDELAHRKESLYYELIHQLQPVPEVLEQIRLQHGKIPFAVVSGSTRESVVKSLEALGLLDLFDTLVCAGDYVHGKPAPDPFLLAASRLGVDPQTLPRLRGRRHRHRGCHRRRHGLHPDRPTLGAHPSRRFRVTHHETRLKRLIAA